MTMKQQNSDKYRSFYAVPMRMLLVMRYKLSKTVPMGTDVDIPLAHQLMCHCWCVTHPQSCEQPSSNVNRFHLNNALT